MVAAARTLGAVAVPVSLAGMTNISAVYLQGMTNFVPGRRNIFILGKSDKGVVFLCCILDCFLAVTASVSV